MMRTLLIFGTIALYLVCAFVPPSQANIRAAAAEVMHMKSGDASAFVSTVVHHIDTIVKSSIPLEEIASNAHATVLVDVASSIAQGDRKAALNNAVHFAVGVAPNIKKAAKSLVKSIANSSVASSPFTLLTENEKNPTIKKQLERIDWAANRSDPKLCKALAETNSVTDVKDVPQFGDLLALCLARVMHDAARCGQINSASASALRAACTEGLDQTS